MSTCLMSVCSRQGVGGKRRKKGNGYDMFDHANEEPVGTVVTEVFKEYKFLARKKWMGYTPGKTGSPCGRLKAVIDLGGRQFSGWLWGAAKRIIFEPTKEEFVILDIHF